jgi:hypothetical protein
MSSGATRHPEIKSTSNTSPACQRITPDWGFEATDDVGTAYRYDDEGMFDGHSGRTATHAVRELGGKIPPDATRLTLRIVPGYDQTGHQWHPPNPGDVSW